MTKLGAFTFVLHSHLPYARQAGMWPHGEEWVHEALAETYLPLLDALNDLREEGVPFQLTIGITPILAEQLGDQLIIEHFVHYASERAAWAAADITRFESAGNEQLAKLARFYHHWYARTLTSFRDRYNKNVLGAFKQLQDDGFIEISTSAATHGYLPLLSRDSSIYGQIATGIAAYKRWFDRDPRAIWLPECAYRPAALDTSVDPPIRRPGIESFLAAQGIRAFFSETHTVEGGLPVGKAAGDAIGPYGVVPRAHSQPLTAEEQQVPSTTFRPYWVGDAPGQVAVMARNNRIGLQVWSGEHGYPGDGVYREFHRKDAVSGMQYWRITGSTVDLGNKEPYDPDIASTKVREHARHFSWLVSDLLRDYHDEKGEFGMISAAYDTELFGHWWFEGVEWLKEVLRSLAASDTVELSTATRIVEEHGPDRVLDLPESSWGAGGNHSTWLNAETEWMWPIIHQCERDIEGLVVRYPDADGGLRDVLNQAARELVLLQSSDWPFLVTTGQAKEYAVERFNEHVARFQQLVALADQASPLTNDQIAFVGGLRDRDNPFPDIDYRLFASRQGRAEIAPRATQAV
ncbi:1,4-alpha-glucan branching protein [soil metagenome]